LPCGDPQDEDIKALTSYGEKPKKVYPKSIFRVLKHFEAFSLTFCRASVTVQKRPSFTEDFRGSERINPGASAFT
jgi:hypothetical protein